MNLVALQTKTNENFQDNLDYLEKLILQTPINSFILAPELCLTEYSYDRLEELANFTNIAKTKLLELSKQRTISLTMTTKKDGKYYNTFFTFKDGAILYTQNKVELFKLTQEDRYFTSGNKDDILIFNYNNLKIAVLICFELRYIDYWQKIRGADIILIPAMWGKSRKDNYETLTQALAVANQCFVIASCSANEEFAKGSSIISPFGLKTMDDESEIISSDIDLKEIKMMRKYLDVGI